MNAERLRAIAEQFASKRILVIGDLMLDQFIWGKVSRISPEAPVPVVEVSSESAYPGGAANVARNLREFATEIGVMGLIGRERHGDELRQLLVDGGINTDGVQQDTTFQTIVKTRIIARHQQVVRVDHERRGAPTAEQHAQALKALKQMLGGLDAIILEDYGKGFLTQQFADEICALVLAAGKIVTIDPNPHNPLQWRGATAVKPNRSEAFVAANRAQLEAADNPLDDSALLEIGALLLEKWGARNVLITLGEQGMMLFERGGKPFHSPTKAREVFDVSGAGDTAIALFTLALISGASAAEATEIANHASGIVVGKLGTATVTRDELFASFENDSAA